jgi:hypothetical protein
VRRIIKRLQRWLIGSWVLFTLLAVANAIAVSAGWYCRL